MIESKFQRVEADAPDRCQGKFKLGQCPYRASPDSTYCPMHGGHLATNVANAERTRMYRLAKWQQRVSEFADNDQVKGLREEIGILRIIMEETLNMCQDSSQLMLYSSKISDTALKIEKVVSSCHRLEASTGILLDKQAALQIAGTIVEIIGRHVQDADTIELIAEEVINVILQTKPETKI